MSSAPFSIKSLLGAAEAVAPRHQGENAGTGKLRQDGLNAFLRQGFNVQGREDWKYSDVSVLARGDFSPFAGSTRPGAELAGFLSGADTYKLVFINGVFSPEMSSTGQMPAGVTLQPMTEARQANPGLLAAYDQAPVTALNTAFWQDGLFLDVADGAALDRPLEIFFLTDEQAAGTMVSPRNLITAGKNSGLTVVEHFTGPARGPLLQTPVTEITCGPDSVVRHLKLVREGEQALHYGSTHVRQLAGSNYTSREFALGGASIRRELHLDLDGQGAECDLTALYMASGSQRQDLRTRVNHNVPGCRTNELYKGILDGQARAVFDGLIKVARDAQQTEAFQTNRNLVLSDDTIAYSIPRLEIYADDVKCSHGSTTGQLDDEQLFFLRSRGFDPLTSRIMLANAFASEIVEGVRNADLRRSLTEEIAARLSRSSVTEARG
jgi:Fe-S cluster assembly protein SufD